ncbi:restriction endonuclease subunit S [Streptomyces antimycoticus]|uniref:restriction endonuclease subunit S n=1 Tax=Streptomyces antimycoticus TaxID=68175 RepID=UPI00342DE909
MLSDKILRLVPAPELVDPEFLVTLISSEGVRRQIGNLLNGGSGQNNISQADIRDLLVPDVSLNEQRQIVAAHASIQQRMTTLGRGVVKMGNARRGLAESHVSGPLVSLVDVLAEKPKNGFSPAETHEWSGMLALGLGCLTREGFVPKQLKYVPDSPMARRFRLSDGDLLMSRANTRELVGLVGRYRDVGHPCIYPDLMMRLRPDPSRCIPEYLELVLSLSSVRRDIQAGARGTSESMVKISSAIVEALRVPIPSLSEQKRAVEAISSLDARIEKQRAVAAKLSVIQQGVAEDSLCGQAMARASV